MPMILDVSSSSMLKAKCSQGTEYAKAEGSTGQQFPLFINIHACPWAAPAPHTQKGKKVAAAAVCGDSFFLSKL